MLVIERDGSEASLRHTPRRLSRELERKSGPDMGYWRVARTGIARFFHDQASNVSRPFSALFSSNLTTRQ
jgi:hypothetical protein